MKAFVTKYPVSCFIGLAFAISLLIGFPLKNLILNDVFAGSEIGMGYLSKIPVVFGPAIAAIIVTYATLGAAGLKALFSRLTPYIEHIIWWFGLPFAGLAITAIAFVVGGFTFGELVAMATSVSPMVLTMHLAGSIVIIGLGEELGWRGWLLPKLAQTRTLKNATILVFITWALWHLPLFFAGYRVAIPFTVIVLALSIIFTWLWNRVGGNVVVLIIAHASVDFSEAFFEERIGPNHSNQVLNAWAALSVIYLVIAAVLFFADKKTWNTTLQPDDERLVGTISPQAAKAPAE
ncbi:CPBP family intramembrane metalloprotease [Mucilaginibacter sp. ZT4R22]|uniref:CPBP family intramembrane metalloprotease n=1 Tax=Mucilaginibacter pankratovii TaxID=2772110 RepID=A0ABR7WRA5_9SPHI|nr:CPBP family intramembrane glutamic endopeptidase [Mucilaginibacter pankratovii]MBD1364845.1 CPBP family intramembrane metalloprotease [Mucilaginibacter pankratovii]